MLAGQEIDGSSVSCAGLTVTRKLQLCPSEVEEVTTVVPRLKKEPLAGVLVTVPHVPPTAGGSKVTTAPLWPSGALMVMLDGQLSVQVGGVGFDAVVSTVELLLELCES